MIAKTPTPPYYAVIFTNRRRSGEGYDEMATAMVELAARQPGFLGVEHAGDTEAITVSYWADEASIAAWKAQADHQIAQKMGREQWYAAYSLRVAKVERAYDFSVDS